MAHGNFTLRGYLADMREEDPRRCWPFQSMVDYHEFRHILESTPAPTNAQINQEGSVGGSTSLADSDDDITLGEWLKRKGLKVQASNIVSAKPHHADSSSGLKPPSSVFVMTEVMVGVPGAGVQAPTMALAEPRSASLFSGLELLSSVALRPEPEEGVGGASVQAPEEPRPDGSSVGLQPLGLRSRMHEPVQGFGGARVQAPETAPARPREREVMVCRVSRNPAEFSTEISNLFLRSL